MEGPASNSNKRRLRLPGRVALRRGLFVGIGLGFLLLGTQGIWRHYSAARGSAPVPSRTVTHTTGQPVETPINGSTYEVPARQPRRIRMPSAGIEGYIQKVGLDQHGAIAAPNNVHLAGWYTDSPIPGDMGVSIIDGHVQGRHADGVFKHLTKLKKDDAITIEYGDHSTRNFTVLEVQTVAADKATEVMHEQRKGVTNQLTLITCAGTFNRATATYEQRTIVIAELR